jgi:glycosyltransferase involved in cell wall biosynthesis
MKAGARILIVTNGQLSRNPRPLKEAVTLGKAGYEVTVLMVRNHAEGERRDREIMDGAPFQRETVDVSSGLGTASWRIPARRLRRRIAQQLGTITGRGSIHALGPAGALLRRARSLRADLTIVHNEVPQWVGARLLKEGRRVAADFEDWHSEDLLPERRRGRPLELLRAIERILLHGAVWTTTTSEALAAALHSRHGGIRPQVITNSFPLQPDPRRGPPGDPPAFFWFSQTLGPGRGLEAFLEAWTRTLQPSSLVLLGDSDGDFRERLLGSTPAQKRHAIAFLPTVRPAELAALIARHDIGLALEQSSITSRNLTITNKILQYLNAGLAVVASDTAGQREVLGRTGGAGIAVSLDDAGALARVLDSLLADRAALARRQAAARRAAEETYCWEREAPRLLSLVERSLVCD